MLCRDVERFNIHLTNFQKYNKMSIIKAQNMSFGETISFNSLFANIVYMFSKHTLELLRIFHNFLRNVTSFFDTSDFNNLFLYDHLFSFFLPESANENIVHGMETFPNMILIN